MTPSPSVPPSYWRSRFRPTAEEDAVVEAAVRAVKRYRRWIQRHSGDDYEGATAVDVVERLMPDASTRRQCQILQLVRVRCKAAGVRMSESGSNMRTRRAS